MHSTIVSIQGVDFEVDYEISPYDPGVTSGPVENCYPPEGGELVALGLFEATIMNGWEALPSEFAKQLFDKYKDEIADELLASTHY